MVDFNYTNDLPGLSDDQFKGDGHQKVELFFSCRNLYGIQDKMGSTPSNPQVSIFKIAEQINGKDEQNLNLIGKTELIQQNNNPDFQNTITVDYEFEVKQEYEFQVHHKFEGEGKEPTLIGKIRTTLGDILGSRNQIAILDLEPKQYHANDTHTQKSQNAKLVIRSEIVDGNPGFVDLKIIGTKLKSSLQYYYEIKRVTGEESSLVVYRSEALKGPDTDWKGIYKSLQTIANNDFERPLNIYVYSQKNKTKKLVGICQFTLSQLQKVTFLKLNLLDPHNKKQVAILAITKFYIDYKHTFLEYIRGGVRLNVIVAIDFTKSNEESKVHKHKSLHKIHEDKTILNDYQKAIEGVCEILLCYDYDKRVPVFGFGAKLSQNSAEANHCFSLNGDERDPYVTGIDGIMEAYKKTLNRVTLSGPTYFSRIMDKAIGYSNGEKRQGCMVYQILLILTDGLIHDMQGTIDRLVKCADLPLSVIIVGVGNNKEEFESMKALDADDEPLKDYTGQTCTRDLVQFVPFDKFKGKKELLAKEVLAEVPAQFLQFMKSQNKFPKPKAEFDISQLLTSQASNKFLNSFGSMKGQNSPVLNNQSLSVGNLTTKNNGTSKFKNGKDEIMFPSSLSSISKNEIGNGVSGLNSPSALPTVGQNGSVGGGSKTLPNVDPMTFSKEWSNPQSQQSETIITQEDYIEAEVDEKVYQKHKANIFYKYSSEEFIQKGQRKQDE